MNVDALGVQRHQIPPELDHRQLQATCSGCWDGPDPQEVILGIIHAEGGGMENKRVRRKPRSKTNKQTENYTRRLSS